MKSFEYGFHGFRIFVGEFGRKGANFLGMILPNILRVQRSEPDAVSDHARIPRLAHTEAVHLANTHVRHHLRRWHRDERHVLVWIDAASSEIITHPHRMRPRRKGHRKCERIIL